MCNKCPFMFNQGLLSAICLLTAEYYQKYYWNAFGNCLFSFYMFRHFDGEKEVFTCMHFKCFLRFSMHFHSPQHVVPKPIRCMSYSVARFELARLFKIGKYVGLTWEQRTAVETKPDVPRRCISVCFHPTVAAWRIWTVLLSGPLKNLLLL